jgi:hypothetical protein
MNGVFSAKNTKYFKITLDGPSPAYRMTLYGSGYNGDTFRNITDGIDYPIGDLGGFNTPGTFTILLPPTTGTTTYRIASTDKQNTDSEWDQSAWEQSISAISFVELYTDAIGVNLSTADSDDIAPSTLAGYALYDNWNNARGGNTAGLQSKSRHSGISVPGLTVSIGSSWGDYWQYPNGYHSGPPFDPAQNLVSGLGISGWYTTGNATMTVGGIPFVSYDVAVLKGAYPDTVFDFGGGPEGPYLRDIQWVFIANQTGGTFTYDSGGNASIYAMQILSKDPLTSPTMAVKGGASLDQTIANGDSSPDPTKGTAFGNALVLGGSVEKTYQISNSGDGDLTGLSASITVGDTADFHVDTQPAGTVAAAPGGTPTTFIVHFAPQSAGAKSATVSIANNGAGNPWTFDVSGTGTADQPPVITEDAGPVAVSMDEDGSPTAFALTLNATDTEDAASSLTWSISSAASHGTAGASGTGASKVITYSPTANYNGSDSFVVTVTDSANNTDTITVNVTIAAVNDAPTTEAGTTVSATEDTEKTLVSTDFPFTDVDAGDVLGAVKVMSLPAHGTLTLVGGGSVVAGSTVVTVTTPGEDVLKYTPNANYNGSDSFNFQVRDASAFSGTATKSITVGAVVDEVVMMAQAYVTPSAPMGTLVGQVQARSPDGAPTYALAGGANQSKFLIDGTSGNLTLASAVTDPVTTKYYVDVSATYGAKTAVQAIVVEVKDTAVPAATIIIFR